MTSRTRNDAPATAERAIRTFLIADIRGYTAFTRERGDEAAAVLASRFAEVVREGVEAWDGELAELLGDEALAVFGSARRALRCALELQDAFLHEVELDPSLPLQVGMGLDAGEAVPVEEGYRGRADPRDQIPDGRRVSPIPPPRVSVLGVSPPSHRVGFGGHASVFRIK